MYRFNSYKTGGGKLVRFGGTTIYQSGERYLLLVLSHTHVVKHTFERFGKNGRRLLDMYPEFHG